MFDFHGNFQWSGQPLCYITIECSSLSSKFCLALCHDNPSSKQPLYTTYIVVIMILFVHLSNVFFNKLLQKSFHTIMRPKSNKNANNMSNPGKLFANIG